MKDDIKGNSKDQAFLNMILNKIVTKIQSYKETASYVFNWSISLETEQ